MLTELLGGYTAYTTAPDVIAEANVNVAGPDEVPISVTYSGTFITLTLSITN